MSTSKPKRICADCPTDITELHGLRARCAPCTSIHDKAQRKAYKIKHRKQQQAKQKAEQEAMQAEQKSARDDRALQQEANKGGENQTEEPKTARLTRYKAPYGSDTITLEEYKRVQAEQEGGEIKPIIAPRGTRFG